MRKKQNQFQYTLIFRGRPVVFKADNKELLSGTVFAFHKKNGIRPTNLDGVIDLVNKRSKVVPFDGIHSTHKPIGRSSGITLHGAFAAAKALVKYTYGDTVDQKEVDRRQAICLKCSEITQASNCMSCGGSRIATNIVTTVKKLFKKNLRFQKRTSRSYCDVCDCSLSLIIPTKIEGFTEEMFNKKGRPATCWIKR